MRAAREWPLAVTAWGWIPPLILMSERFGPRPEMFSFLLIAAFLGVLLRVDGRPELAWVLPALQVFWVNVHALFVLGPVIMACYLADRLIRGFKGGIDGPAGRAWWRHVGPAGVLLMLACLLNPYGVQGALFPGQLFGKIASVSNPYKTYIAEFMSPRGMVQDKTVAVAAGHLYLCAYLFLMLVIPWSFLLPAAWRRWVKSGRRRAARLWTAGMLAGVTLCAIGAVGLPSPDVPAWLARSGRLSPMFVLALGIPAASAWAGDRGKRVCWLGSGRLLSLPGSMGSAVTYLASPSA